MNFADTLALALRNLRQAKLRTALTAVGVVIGVAAIISMVSFGLGLQQNIIANALSKLEVFTSITVFGASADALIEMNQGRTAFDDPPQGEAATASPSPAASPNASPDASPTDTPPTAPPASPAASPSPQLGRFESRRVLDDDALAEIEKIGGVRYVLPNVSFSSYLRFDGRTRRVSLSGAPLDPERLPGFKSFVAGGKFTGEDAQELIVSEDFAERFASGRRRERRGPFAPAPTPDPQKDVERAEAARKLIGREVVLLTLKGADAAPSSVFGIPLLNPPAGEAAQGENPEFESRFERHTFRIVGVLPSDSGNNFGPFGGLSSLLVPMEQAKRFREANQDPLARMGEALAGDAGYSTATVRVVDPTQMQSVFEQLNKMGFRAFSLTNQVEEIKRVFLIVNGSLALIGGIALLVASFGISNTMIMSITERTREIGIMKAIGGADGEIMRIFFCEASLIGFVGGVFGVLAGWGVDRLANALVNNYIVKAATRIEFFSIPWYLWGGAILFAILISLMAAVYPAFRAARVDPIKALRHD
jgi:ABC-type lipoprotein release transport system permease subunit